jgi:hypothetical protein
MADVCLVLLVVVADEEDPKITANLEDGQVLGASHIGAGRVWTPSSLSGWGLDFERLRKNFAYWRLDWSIARALKSLKL